MQKKFTKEHTNIAKGFAIILLLIYHLFGDQEHVINMGVNYQPFTPDMLHLISKFGNVCVSIFVFLTAYGISRNIFEQEDISLKKVYKQAVNRFGKLMFHFFLLYVSVIAVMFPHFDLKGLYGTGWQGGVQMLTDALGLSMFYKDVTLNQTWWYMEVAYIMVFLVPALTWLVKKIGYAIIPIMYFLPFVVDMNFDIERYLLVASVGVCASYGNWIVKVMEWKKPTVIKWLISIVGLVGCVIFRQNYLIQEQYLAVADAGISLFIICAVTITVGSIYGIKNVLAFIGRHSMNIFLVHSFFYMAIWQKEIYSFKYAFLILCVLLAVSLLYSVILEEIKRLGRWCIGRIRNKIK